MSDTERDQLRDLLAQRMAEFEAHNGPVETTPIKFATESPGVIRSPGGSNWCRKKIIEPESQPKPRKAEYLKPAPRSRKPKRHEVLETRLGKLAELLGVTPTVLKAYIDLAELNVRLVGNWEKPQ